MRPTTSLGGTQSKQRGVVLFVALIMLIVMTLAGLALLRQLGVGSSIAGNVAFKEGATYVADRGTEIALQYINPQFPALPPNLDAESPANGYTSSWADGTNPAALPWGLGRTVALPDAGAMQDIGETNNTADLFIQRLCANLGVNPLDPAQTCSDILVDNPLRTHGNPGSAAPLPSTTSTPFYRVTARVIGPRSTVSYTQVLLY